MVIALLFIAIYFGIGLAICDALNEDQTDRWNALPVSRSVFIAIKVFMFLLWPIGVCIGAVIKAWKIISQ